MKKSREIQVQKNNYFMYIMVTILFTVTLIIPTSQTQAVSLEEDSVITFESGIPEEISVSDDSEISINNERYQDGNSSLQWDYHQGDQLIIDTPIEYNSDIDTFGIWIYNEQPVDDHLTFEFNSENEVSSSFEFKMNFEGWRTAWVPFIDMNGTPKAQMNNLTITAPQSEAGKVILDQIVLSNPVDTRHPTRDEQVPFVNIKADTSPSGHWQALLLYDSWIPASFEDVQVTDEDLQGIEMIEERYLDFTLGDGNRITTEQMDNYRNTFASYNISRDAGYITGRPVNLLHIDDIYPSNIRGDLKRLTNYINVRQYTDFMLNIAKAYDDADNGAYHDELRSIYVDLLEHMIDQGWAHGSSLGAMHHLGYNMRGLYPSVLIMKDELDADLLEKAQDSMIWFTGMGRIYENPDDSYPNIDIINTTLQGMVAVLLSLDDEQKKAALITGLRDWLDDGLMPAPGLMPSLKIDGSGFHHMGFYPAYARGAYNNIAPVVYFLNRTPFSLSEQPHEMLKKAILSMRIFSNSHEWLLSVAGRHPTGNESLTSHAFRYLAMAGTPDGSQEIDPDLAGAYLRLVEPDRIDEFTHMLRDEGYTAEVAPSGNWTMNYGALALHRRDEWLVGVKGHNRYVWAGELYTDANWYGRYISYGQIQIMGQEDPETGNVTNEASGFSHDGWNWNRWPGTTTKNLPLDDLKATSFTEMLLSDQTFAGGLNIQGENGMFGMILREHPKYDYSHQARKSVFMFDDRVIALGSDIENDDGIHNTETTLFQNHMQTQDEPIWLSETGQINQFSFNEEYETNDSFWMVDNKGNGYYIPAGQSIGVSRGLQHSKHQQNGNDTQGNFSTAWINHGAAPDNESYEYAIIVDADDSEMEAFQQQMNSTDSPYTVLQKDRDAHIVYDLATNITGYALFEENDNIDVGHLVSVDVPSMVMVKEESDDTLVLSTVDPDLRLYEGRDEEQYDQNGNFIGQGPYSRPWIENESMMNTSQITLAGIWDLNADGANYRFVAHTEDGNTILEFDYKDALPIEVELLAAGDQTEPEEPTDPEEPVDPEEPTDPEEPVDQEEPVDPIDPEDQEEPVDPNDPEDQEEPTDPTDPEDPEEPVDSTDSEDTNEEVAADKGDDGSELPKTASSMYNLLLIGAILLALGSLTYVLMRKRTKA